MLAFRAASPAGVFTQENKAIYLGNVTDIPGLSILADAIWEDDPGMLEALPPSFGWFKDRLVTLMRSAYERGIRPADPKV